MQDKKKMIAETSDQLGFITLENEVVLDSLLVSDKIPSCFYWTDYCYHSL
jgi:hypothetical protein